MRKCFVLFAILSTLILNNHIFGNLFYTNQFVDFNVIEDSNVMNLNQQNTFLLTESEIFKTIVVPIFMILIGLGIKIIWLFDLFSGKFGKFTNFFNWIEGENLLWPHVFAEFITAILLLISAIGLMLSLSWGIKISLVALGALFYTSLNSTAWVFVKKERLKYGIPMFIAFIGSIFSIFILLN